MIKHALLLLLAALCVSCNDGPQVAPRFHVPSTRPIHREAGKVDKGIKDAQKAAKQIEGAKTLPEARRYVLQLQNYLSDAQIHITLLEQEVVKLDLNLKAETKKANDLADRFDKSDQRRVKAEAIVKQVDSYWGFGAILYGAKRLVSRLLFGSAILLGLGIVAAGVAAAFGVNMPKLFGSVIGVATSFFRK